jgi:mono/diheme cytochrome c family protein
VFALAGDRPVTSMAASRPVVLSFSGVPPKPPAKPGAATAPAAGGGSAAAISAVFSTTQAARGEQVFARACASCHTVAEQTGPSFASRWGSGTLADVYTLIATTMPQGQPGSLSRDDYAAVVAFMLQRSGFTAGVADLPADTAELAKVPVKGLPK